LDKPSGRAITTRIHIILPWDINKNGYKWTCFVWQCFNKLHNIYICSVNKWYQVKNTEATCLSIWDINLKIHPNGFP
jgi:hypothetical protein